MATELHGNLIDCGFYYTLYWQSHFETENHSGNHCMSGASWTIPC